VARVSTCDTSPGSPHRAPNLSPHQIAELVTSKSSRMCGDDSAFVSAKCRGETNLKPPLKTR